jgi:hypothetical protein
MIDGWRISAFIPSGRKRTESILLTNLRRFDPIIDEVQVWLNTDGDERDRENHAPNTEGDREWLLSLPDHWDKIKLYELPEGWVRRYPKQYNTHAFYRHTVDPETLYFRFDDDVVYIDDAYFTNMVRARLAHPAVPLVYAADHPELAADHDIEPYITMTPSGWLRRA